MHTYLVHFSFECVALNIRLAGKVNSSKNRLAKEVSAKRGVDGGCGWENEDIKNYEQ